MQPQITTKTTSTLTILKYHLIQVALKLYTYNFNIKISEHLGLCNINENMNIFEYLVLSTGVADTVGLAVVAVADGFT